ncbi:MAG: efflux RND transporter periplasmic adaptor subunit [Candidatus Aminicenantales bacterium]
MKARSLILLAVGILIGATAVYFLMPKPGTSETASLEQGKQLYSCGMHPEVISDEPGNCPICGMKLTPIKSTAPGQSETQAGGQKKQGKVLYWRAPMDPTEIYDRPGKSKMGMDLVPVYEGEEAGGAGSITINPAVQQNMNLRTAPVERRDISVVIRSFGTVTYAQDNEFSVNTKIGGWIEKLHVNTVGQRVRRGDPLLEIYSPELVSTQEEYLLALRNQEKLAESPYENIRQNAARMLTVSRNRLAYWDISEAEIKEIEKSGRVRRTILLTAPVNGTVTHKAVVEGDRVGPGMDLLHITDLSKVWVEAGVYESEIPLLRLGQKTELELDYRPGYKLEGEVDFIYPYLDRKSRSNNVRLIFKNPEGILKPDMYATVRIFAPTIDAVLAVPSEAILHSGTRDIVFVAKEGGTFEPREVRTGVESDDGFVQVLSGLLDGEKVVVSGQFLLDSESRTREAIAKMRASSEAKAQESPMEMGTSKTETKMTDEQPGAHEFPLEMPVSAPPEKSSHTPEGTKLTVDLNKLYACPMHPDFITTDPKARCPECGMNVVPIKQLGDKVQLEKAELYTCPMHPEFLTTDAEGECPECGMKLEKVKKKRSPGD